MATPAEDADFLLWRERMAPLLYDSFSHHSLGWPTQACRWGLCACGCLHARWAAWARMGMQMGVACSKGLPGDVRASTSASTSTRPYHPLRAAERSMHACESGAPTHARSSCSRVFLVEAAISRA